MFNFFFFFKAFYPSPSSFGMAKVFSAAMATESIDIQGSRCLNIDV